MRCYRRLLNIPYKEHVTSEDVHRKILAAIAEYDKQLTMVSFGHISMSSGLAKTILQDTTKEKKRNTSRQNKKSEDSIKEWAGICGAPTILQGYEVD